MSVIKKILITILVILLVSMFAIIGTYCYSNWDNVKNWFAGAASSENIKPDDEENTNNPVDNEEKSEIDKYCEENNVMYLEVVSLSKVPYINSTIIKLPEEPIEDYEVAYSEAMDTLVLFEENIFNDLGQGNIAISGYEFNGKTYSSLMEIPSEELFSASHVTVNINLTYVYEFYRTDGRTIQYSSNIDGTLDYIPETPVSPSDEYTFLGWSTVSGVDTENIVDLNTYVLDKNTKFYPVFVNENGNPFYDEFTITFAYIVDKEEVFQDITFVRNALDLTEYRTTVAPNAIHNQFIGDDTYFFWAWSTMKSSDDETAPGSSDISAILNDLSDGDVVYAHYLNAETFETVYFAEMLEMISSSNVA